MKSITHLGGHELPTEHRWIEATCQEYEATIAKLGGLRGLDVLLVEFHDQHPLESGEHPRWGRVLDSIRVFGAKDSTSSVAVVCGSWHETCLHALTEVAA